jgi:hypothetical protein
MYGEPNNIYGIEYYGWPFAFTYKKIRFFEQDATLPIQDRKIEVREIQHGYSDIVKLKGLPNFYFGLIANILSFLLTCALFLTFLWTKRRLV